MASLDTEQSVFGYRHQHMRLDGRNGPPLTFLLEAECGKHIVDYAAMPNRDHVKLCIIKCI